ncbi:type VII secretion protein EccB [Antrihabitans stalactiti]|uniref:Type VII secretion protein EccB n=1 Tax=Antrihabitans stalactiti TaxID=2584121 RepID=A0A848KDA8_9NOCA|nr:type VII secretion protein EccB [Antrihabitans stalactiti]NMN96241.1 type VII secretion protein EccB [Antrihabitans stalactiti]
MAAQPTTRLQVSGYRFLVRRMEHALVRRDVRMLHDPMRSQSRSLMVGAILASLGLAACAVLALLRPQDKLADNKIVVGKDSGAMFVIMGDTLHPVLNLASARLIVGSAAKPAIIKESELAKKPRGPLVGIPGAPSALPFDRSGSGRTWTVCDAVGSDGSSDLSTSVLIGDPTLGEHISDLGGGNAILVKNKDATYLVYDGKRAKVDVSGTTPDSTAVIAALALEGVTPRAISPGLFNAIPEVPQIVPPKIDAAGSKPSKEIAGQNIGAVIQSTRNEKTQYYVVLRDGVQAISSVTKDLIRFTNPSGSKDVEKVEPFDINKAGVVERLDVATYPETALAVTKPDEKPVSCLSWKPVRGTDEDSRSAQVSLLSGRALPIPDKSKAVKLAQADGSGEKADTVYLHPGDGAYIQATGIDPDSLRKDGTFFVADTGVRFGVPAGKDATALGFDTNPEPAPWPIVSLLAHGRTLDRESAVVAYDGLAPDDSTAALPEDSAN